jgi:DNA-binding transcriptional ArsR family regulator
MGNRLLAGRLDLLKFIKKRKLVYAYEIEENFGYSHRSVPNTLTRLKKAGLIINMTKGCWELTEKGFRKLKYYGI